MSELKLVLKSRFDIEYKCGNKYVAANIYNAHTHSSSARHFRFKQEEAKEKKRESFQQAQFREKGRFLCAYDEWVVYCLCSELM